VEVLDNPVYYSLTGPHAAFAEGSSLAVRYEPDVGAFGALPDEPTAQAWGAMWTLVGPGHSTLLVRTDGLDVPPGWRIGMRLLALQMVATERIGESDAEFVALGRRDVPEMLDLVARTRPGPFFNRTVELGTYLGMREGPDLVAMAGVRMHPPGYTEISAVCTDERARKRGLASRLVRAIAADIEARGETPMLHVSGDNESAIRIYESLGFVTRAAFDVIVAQAPR
jgi:ribosomal protein S18 acetylase RimI-like enzyme